MVGSWKTSRIDCSNFGPRLPRIVPGWYPISGAIFSYVNRSQIPLRMETSASFSSWFWWAMRYRFTSRRTSSNSKSIRDAGADTTLIGLSVTRSLWLLKGMSLIKSVTFSAKYHWYLCPLGGQKVHYNWCFSAIYLMTFNLLNEAIRQQNKNMGSLPRPPGCEAMI